MPTPLPFQFRTRTLMASTAAVGVGLWLAFVVPTPFGFLAFWGLALLGIGPVIGPGRSDPPRRADALLFPAALAAAVAAEWHAAHLAYFTLSTIHRDIMVLAIGLNVPAVGLLLGKRRRWAYGWVAALALWLVPYPLVLGLKWRAVDREANAVVAYAQAHQARTGRYPADLGGYVFTDPSVRGSIRYDPDPPGFQVIYYVGSRWTMHVYRSGIGWFYVDD